MQRCNTTTEPIWIRVRGACSVALAALAMLAATAAEARADTVDAEAKILLRAASFDRSLGGRAGADVVITVVYDGRAPGSQRERDSRVQSFRKLADRTIAGLPMKVTSLDCAQVSALAESLRAADIVYLTAGGRQCVRAVTAATRKLRIASLTSGRALVEQGITIGVSMEGSRPKLLVNLVASREEGLNLAAQMLQLAEVIK
jgi:hypothetical protein